MGAFYLMVTSGTAFLVSALLSRFLSRYRGRWALLDVPNQRSLHMEAKPRSGGLAILAGLIAAVAISPLPLPVEYFWQFALALSITAGVSLADDVRPLPPLLRLGAHAFAAWFLVYGAGCIPATLILPGTSWAWPAWLGGMVTLLCVMWMINLYNFMDGMDGFAAGMAVFGFGTLASMAWIADAHAYAAVALTVALAAAGFLLFNFPPARLFMGDVGSGSLGLLAAALLLWADRAGIFPLWIGVLPFAPFIVDATWTVIRRTAQGKRPWQAHREHFYQRLVQLGWSHRRTVLAEYVLMLNCSLMALGCLCSTDSGVQGVMLGEMTAVFAACIAGINVLERRRALRAG